MADEIDRIRELLATESLELIELAVEIDEKYQRMKNILGRRQRLPADVVRKIVEHYGIDANWLLTGTGRMYRVPPDLLEEKMRVTLTDDDQQWLELGRRLPEADRVKLAQGVKKCAKGPHQQKEEQSTEAGALSPRDRIWLEIGQGLSEADRTRLQEIGAALVSARELKDKAKDK